MTSKSDLKQHERDAFDLRILQLLDQGMTQAAVAERMGCTRGRIAVLVRDIRADDAANRSVDA